MPLGPSIKRLMSWVAKEPLRVLELETTPELGLLTQSFDIDTFVRGALPEPGLVLGSVSAVHIEESVMLDRLSGCTAGQGAPPWHDGSGGAPMAGVHVCRVPNVLHAPEFGAVITAAGQVLRWSVAEALFLTPSLSALPFVGLVEEKPVMTLLREPPTLKAAAVFVAWGGRFNYGHFLLDCLSTLAALDALGMLEQFPLIAPPLNRWQRECLILMLGTERAGEVQEIASPLVQIDEVVFASPMDHFLHAPNRPLERVREAMLANLNEPETGLTRLYISRRDDRKRWMINEAELEAAMSARGFAIIYPEDLPVARQVALFRDADVIVAPTGAALANTLFCKPGAKVFEIQPTNYVGIWARGVCQFVSAHWHGFFAPSPRTETHIVIEGTARPAMQFEWVTPLEPFLAFLDSHLQDCATSVGDGVR